MSLTRALGWRRARLIAFFADMAASWRGWAGAKEWNDDGPGVAMSATHDGVGTIALRVATSPSAGWEGPGSWKVAAVVGVDPGSLDATVDALRRLLE
jgi:hypothetical protein